MAIIKERFMENGKKIIVLECNSKYIDTTFKNIVKMAPELDCDEIRMHLNYRDLVFDKYVTFFQLQMLFRGYAPEFQTLTKEEYHEAEFHVGSFHSLHWAKKERYQALEMMLDQALLTNDIEWAKAIYSEQKELAKNIFKQFNN